MFRQTLHPISSEHVNLYIPKHDNCAEKEGCSSNCRIIIICFLFFHCCFSSYAWGGGLICVTCCCVLQLWSDLPDRWPDNIKIPVKCWRGTRVGRREGGRNAEASCRLAGPCWWLQMPAECGLTSFFSILPHHRSSLFIKATATTTNTSGGPVWL